MHKNVHPQKVFLTVMRISILQFVLTILFSSAAVAHAIKGQGVLDRRISIEVSNLAVKTVLKKIERNAAVRFAYQPQLLFNMDRVSVAAEDTPLSDVLRMIFRETVHYEAVGEQIILKESFFENRATIAVQGTVTDENKQPFPGVNVLEKGTANGTVTDANGKFSLHVDNESSVLVFSSIGYAAQELTVGNQSDINIAMQPDVKQLDDVVVVGYGTQKKVNLTGSVATVQMDDIQNRQVTNSLSALQGKVAGLRITQGSGMPGREAVSMQLRGASSWGTNSAPLVLVDGVVGALDNLPITDIESISVLKDAASASIYGARAANGVILVTTKKGKIGKPVLSYNTSVRSQSATGVPKQIWNSAQYMELFNKAVGRNAISAVPFPQTLIDRYKDPNRDKNLYPDHDWSKEVWKHSLMQEHNAGVSGGSENIQYNMSAGIINQDGILIGHKYKRFNGLANLSATINKYVSVGTTINYLKGDSKSPYYENQNFVLMTMTQAPMVKPYLPDGSGRYTDKVIPTGTGGAQNNRNPFWIANETFKDYADWQANIQGWADINFIHGKNMKLKWSSKYASRFVEQFQKIYHYGADAYYYLPESAYVVGGSDKHQKGTPFGPEAVVVVNNNYRTILNTFFSSLNWDWHVNAHDISVMGGYSQEDQKYRWLTGNRSVFPVKDMFELDGLGPLNQVVGGGLSEWAFRSLFGRATYAFKSKYLFEANFRYDGTSRIFKDNRWGFFPSASAAWRLSEENFIRDNAKWLDNLKIRASYGRLGNANIGDYPWQETYSTTTYSFNETLGQGVLQTSYKNKNIEWEKTDITNLGLDFNVENDIIYGTIDVYNKYTKGILAPASIPSSTGMSAPTVNFGEFKNYGIELDLGHRKQIGNVRYGVNAQVSVNRNKVMKFPAPVYGTRIVEEGRPYQDYYLYEYTGIFKTADELTKVVTPGNPQIGDIKFKDQNHDGKIDGSDRIPVKGAYPDFIYSFGGNVSWKEFDLSLFFQGVEGQKVITNFFGEDPFSQSSSPHPRFLNAFDPATNPDSDVPAIYGWGYAPMTGGTARGSTYFLKNASYLRLKNVVLSYTVPRAVSGKAGISNLKIFIAGDNVLTFTKYPDLDPERASDGWHAQYPQLKVYSVGLNLKF